MLVYKSAFITFCGLSFSFYVLHPCWDGTGMECASLLDVQQQRAPQWTQVTASPPASPGCWAEIPVYLVTFFLYFFFGFPLKLARFLSL